MDAFEDDLDETNLLGTIVPVKLLADIGTVAVYFSLLDNLLNRILWALLRIKRERGLVVTQSINSFASRVELFRALANQRHPGHKTRISSLVQHLRFAGDDRNRLMHDDIVASSEDPDREDRASITTYRGDDPYLFDFDTLRNLQYRLRWLYDTLMDFGTQDPNWLTARLPLLDKSPTQLLRKKNEEAQRLEQRQRPQQSSRRKPRSKRKD